MRLLVIRHAIAEDREEFAATGQPDDLRPLTTEGAKKMKRAAKGLRRIVPAIDVLATSPYTRAVETAEIVAARYNVTPIVNDDLIPEQPFPGLVDWLRGLDDVDVTAIVGHEPHLSTLVSWLVTGSSTQLLELKKGACCMLTFAQQPAQSGARLLWALTPGQLRLL